MESIEIIPIGPELIDEILSIQAECGLSEWTREGYLDELDRPDSVLIGALVDEVIAGFLAGRAPASTKSQPSQADIYNIGIRSASRRKGIGTALLTAFLETCDNRGVEKAWLDVRTSNVVAIAFYVQHGFSKTGSRKSFYTNPTEDADVMCRIAGRPPGRQRY